MKRLIFASGLILSACSEPAAYTSAKTALSKVILRTINSHNDVQLCYDPINCLLMPENFNRIDMDFLAARQPANFEVNAPMNAPQVRGPASVGPAPSPTPIQEFSPLMAAKIEEIKKLAKQPLTINTANIDVTKTHKDETKTESLDFQIAGLKPEELKTFCEHTNANDISVYSNYIHCEWLSSPLSTQSDLQPISLQVNGELKKGETVSVKVDSFDKTAGSELLVEWKVRFHGHELPTAKSSTLTLNNLKAGFYQVTAQIGGKQEENISLIVE
jgi:hypothetical protein